MTRTQVNFVTDELGRRVEGFGAEARRIVAEGLEAGLGRDDLSAALQAAAQDALAGRSAFYWDVVAGAFVGNGRSYAQLSSYAEAGNVTFDDTDFWDIQTDVSIVIRATITNLAPSF